MTCAVCTFAVPESDVAAGRTFCGHHLGTVEDWAAVNRIANDFFMRGIVPTPDPDVELVDDEAVVV